MVVQLFDGGIFKPPKINILALPTEILTEIFKEVVTSSFRSDDPQELRKNFKTLCLVHPTFYVITQNLMIPSHFGLYLSRDAAIPAEKSERGDLGSASTKESIANRFGSGVSGATGIVGRDEWVSVAPNENHANAEMSKDKPKQWLLLFECWETMKDLVLNMDKNTFRDHITLLKKNAVEADFTPGEFGVKPASFRCRVLLNASVSGHLFVVKFVLNHNSNISIDLIEESLESAIFWGRLEVVKEILRVPGISEKAKNESLEWVAFRGDLEVVKELLRVPGISKESKGYSLNLAASRGDLEMVKELLRAPGISEEAKGKSLNLAASRGDLEVVKELLRVPGISKESKGYSLNLAASRGGLEMVKELLRAPGISAAAKGYSLILAASRGDLEMFKELLREPGISEKAKAKSLKEAASRGHLVEVVNELLKEPGISEETKKERRIVAFWFLLAQTERFAEMTF